MACSACFHSARRGWRWATPRCMPCRFALETKSTPSGQPRKAKGRGVEPLAPWSEADKPSQGKQRSAGVRYRDGFPVASKGRSMLRWRSRRSGMAALLGKSTPRARGARALYRRSQSSFASYLTPAHSGRPWAFSCPTQSGTVTNVWPTGHNIWPGGHDMHGIPRRCVLLHSRLAETAGIFSEPGGWK